MRLTKATLKAVHVRQVERVRKLIADAAAKFIAGQLRHAAGRLRAVGTPEVSLIFDPRDHDEALKKALSGPIARGMMLGAASELAIRPKKSKSSATDYLMALGVVLDDDFVTEFPPTLVTAIELALADSFQRPYWAHINDVTRSEIQARIAHGVEQGSSIRDMARELENMAGGYSRARATAIARTESTRALNNGHLLGIKETENQTGIQFGKTWLSVQGSTTRETHAAADGITVSTSAPFVVGGEQLQYPGDAAGSPDNVVNCLCSLVAGDLDLADE